MNSRKIHYLSGLTITLFIAVHLLNHMASIFGAEAHLSIMNILRVVYRNAFVETILFIVVSVQIGSGLKLFFSKKSSRYSFFGKLHIWTGLYLAFFLTMHVGAVLVGRYFLGLDTNFYFGVAGLNEFPLNLFFIPYYGFAIVAFFGHIASVHAQKMNIEIFGIAVERQAKFILITGIIVTLITLFGLTNGFTGVEIPAEYQIIK